MTTLEQEQKYQFKKFSNDYALAFGINVKKIIEQEGLKPVRARVYYDGDIVYQFLMNSKKGDMWLNRKQKTVLESGHSSMYVFEHQEDYPHMLSDEHKDEYAVCGGGFPLIEDGEVKGVFIVSGLTDVEDHDVLVRALEKVFEENNLFSE